MAIIENKVTAEGDVLIIKPEVPVVGLVSLLNFVDTTVNESATDYFLKEFRYSVDAGITFSSWIELTLPNIQSVSISKENQFVIEYRYTRVGNAPEVELEFEDILVSGEIEELPYPIYKSIYFDDFFNVNDINVYGWALNVLEKLYMKGILPEYMTRGQKTTVITEDLDFLSLWGTITHYFAILVYFARQFRDITQHQKLVESFLLNKGLEVGNADIEEVLLLFYSYIEEIGKRGSYQITDKKVDGYTIDGELIRLINYEDPDEFILAHLKPEEIGWCVGISSPVWNGTENIKNLIKGYEFTKEVVDLNKYPLINPSYISIDGDDMLIQNVPVGSTSGIYQDGDSTKMLNVNKNLDYEVSFMCKLGVAGTKVTFGIKGYDESGNNVNLLRATDGVSSNNFFTTQTFKTLSNYYWVRGIIYNQNENVNTNKTMFPNGVHLKFDPNTNIKKIVPNILLDNTTGASSNSARFYNIKIRPLKTPLTRGQLGMKNIILGYFTNNNLTYSLNKVENKIKNSLLPANSFFKGKYL